MTEHKLFSADTLKAIKDLSGYDCTKKQKTAFKLSCSLRCSSWAVKRADRQERWTSLGSRSCRLILSPDVAQVTSCESMTYRASVDPSEGYEIDWNDLDLE
jgi:hypothetical protein